MKPYGRRIRKDSTLSGGYPLQTGVVPHFEDLTPAQGGATLQPGQAEAWHSLLTKDSQSLVLIRCGYLLRLFLAFPILNTLGDEAVPLIDIASLMALGDQVFFVVVDHRLYRFYPFGTVNIGDRLNFSAITFEVLPPCNIDVVPLQCPSFDKFLGEIGHDFLDIGRKTIPFWLVHQHIKAIGASNSP